MAEKINYRQLSLRNVRFFFMDEYVDDEKDELIPATHPLSFRGQIGPLFFDRVRPDLLMPKDQIVFPTPENIADLPRMIEEAGGIEVCYGGIGIHGRALLEYWDGHPELAESMGKSEAGHAPDAASAAATAIQLPFPESAPPRPAPYEIETVQPYSEGKAVYRVTIRDETRTAFDIERAVRPEIVRILREAFAADSPGVSESSIRAYAIPDFGPDRTLLFTGRAFSLEPVADGWEYDQAGRGRIRLRLSGGMTPEEAKRWARENIAAIVAEKNVVLKAGQMPPAGATFRSLGETFEDGVLSIDFVTEQ